MTSWSHDNTPGTQVSGNGTPNRSTWPLLWMIKPLLGPGRTLEHCKSSFARLKESGTNGGPRKVHLREGRTMLSSVPNRKGAVTIDCLQALEKYKHLRMKKHMREFLGLATYYR